MVSVLPSTNNFLSLSFAFHCPLSSDFRPISLTSLYKIISKVLATKLKKVLPTIINDSQMAFVVGRKILDAILIASEAIDEWSLKGRKGVLLKLDLDKACDKVDWAFLDMAMKLKDFGKRWRRWIWGCLSTTNFSIIVNGKILAKRGIRQGDPLAPFLFTFYDRGRYSKLPYSLL